MIEHLDITGYRCFEKLRIEGLTRINLFIGRNNAGKTSMLEAIELLFLRQHPVSLYRSSWRRREFQSRNPGLGDSELEAIFDVRQLFYGRQLTSPIAFSIAAAESNKTHRIKAAIYVGHSFKALETHVDQQRQPGFALKNDFLPVNSHKLEGVNELTPPIIFSSTTSIGPDEQARLWDLIVGNEDEDFVTDALRALEPKIERIIFTTGGGQHGQAPAAFIRMKDVNERIPLGNLGHGASRLLDLALLMVQAKDGVFLVDEIEVGLHHSVMQPVWQLISQTAERLNIQVFVSTHSRDCLEALAELYRLDQKLVNAVNVYRLDPGATTAQRFSMHDLDVADEAQLELRGLL